MKKIIGLLMITMLVLTGCGFEEDKNNLLENGYVENTTVAGNTALYKSFGEGYINQVYDEEQFILIYAAYGTGDKYTYIESDIKTGDNMCGTVVDDSNKSANCNDVYEYIKLKDNEMMTELILLYDKYNIDYVSNSTGDASNISDIIEDKISITNLVVTDSDYTNQFIEEDFVDGEEFVSVSFDVTNLEYESGLELNEISYGGKLCYTIETGEKCSSLSSYGKGAYSSTSDEVLQLDSTKTLKFTSTAPKNAQNYFIKVNTYDSEGNKLIYESDKVTFI